MHLFYYRSFPFIDSLEAKITAGSSDNTAGNLAEMVCWAGSEVQLLTNLITGRKILWI